MYACAFCTITGLVTSLRHTIAYRRAEGAQDIGKWATFVPTSKLYIL